MNLAEAKGHLRLTQGEATLLPSVKVADTFALRSFGLMGKSEVPKEWGAGLFFPNCRSLHGCFMRFDLDVWFLDAEGQPMGGARKLKPWGMVVGPRGARHCMEISPKILDSQANTKWVWLEDTIPLA